MQRLIMKSARKYWKPFKVYGRPFQRGCGRCLVPTPCVFDPSFRRTYKQPNGPAGFQIVSPIHVTSEPSRCERKIVSALLQVAGFGARFPPIPVLKMIAATGTLALVRSGKNQKRSHDPFESGYGGKIDPGEPLNCRYLKHQSTTPPKKSI